MPEPVIIPYKHLKPDTLHNLIEEVVSRDGTDYGEAEVPLETRIEQVMAKLKTGRAVVVFDKKTGTVNILAADDPRLTVLC